MTTRRSFLATLAAVLPASWVASKVGRRGVETAYGIADPSRVALLDSASAYERVAHVRINGKEYIIPAMDPLDVVTFNHKTGTISVSPPSPKLRALRRQYP